MPKYLLDSNVFIQSQNQYYPMDVCPGFWDFLELRSKDGSICSIENVYDELQNIQDNISAWATERKASFFMPFDDTATKLMTQVSAWTYSLPETYKQSAKSEFLSAADCFLVAYAMAHGFTIVTHEVSSASFKRIKLPHACDQLGVQCVNVFQMLRSLGASFGLRN